LAALHPRPGLETLLMLSDAPLSPCPEPERREARLLQFFAALTPSSYLKGVEGCEESFSFIYLPPFSPLRRELQVTPRSDSSFSAGDPERKALNFCSERFDFLPGI